MLDDELVELRDADPNRTVLQWLREDRGLTGTKEGCAEGDCGACAVVVAELSADGAGLTWRAINSCIQLLPTLDGKQLVTVEGLGDPQGRLHPVQQAMIDHHGSQCGFCTPGFVMALFELYQTGAEPSRRDIDNALAGNLCRCTGYRPIIAAAEHMHDYEDESGINERAPTVADRLRTLALQAPLAYRAAGKRFFAPHDAGELSALLEQHPGARILAGGTDVGLWVTKDYRELDTVIYVGRVGELQQIRRTPTHLEIGAAVTFTAALGPLLEVYPELEELLLRFAGPPIRNAATLGGNVANGSPIGDSMPVLIALGTEVVLRSGQSQRSMPMEQFYLGYRKTDLRPGEFLAELRIPLPVPGQHVRTYKISKRFDQDISAVCAAFSVWLDDGMVVRARVAFGGVAATPARALHCEDALTGKAWTEATVSAAMASLDRDFSPLTDLRASEGYRRRVSRNLLLRFFHDVAPGGPPVSLYHYGR